MSFDDPAVNARIIALWGRVMPHQVSETQAYLWLSQYAAKTVEYAIRRTASKRLKEEAAGLVMTISDCIRYAASVMRHETAQARQVMRQQQ